jgi:hypothetical protein
MSPFEGVRHLSARGKNTAFLEFLLGELQLDRFSSGDAMRDFSSFKSSFTPRVIQRLYEQVQYLWPDANDLDRIYKAERNRHSGLCFGAQHAQAITKTISRHCLHSDSLLISDPFRHPKFFNREYSPLTHPEKHTTNCLRAAQIWLILGDWVAADIVHFIPQPGDFDADLCRMERERNRKMIEEAPELRDLLNQISKNVEGLDPDFPEYCRLQIPNELIAQETRKDHPEWSEDQVQSFISYVEDRRKLHPYYTKTDADELLAQGSGVHYGMAKVIANMSGAHLISDSPLHWKQIEADRATGGGIEDKDWSAFASVFDALPIKYLDNVELDFAFHVRKEGRLEELRSYFRKLWRSSSSHGSSIGAKAEDLAAEIREQVRTAEQEWTKINQSFTTWTAGSAVVGLGAAAIVSGWANLVPGMAIGGVTGATMMLGLNHERRRRLLNCHPAGMLLSLKRRNEK